MTNICTRTDDSSVSKANRELFAKQALVHTVALAKAFMPKYVPVPKHEKLPFKAFCGLGNVVAKAAHDALAPEAPPSTPRPLTPTPPESPYLRRVSSLRSLCSGRLSNALPRPSLTHSASMPLLRVRSWENLVAPELSQSSSCPALGSLPADAQVVGDIEVKRVDYQILGPSRFAAPTLTEATLPARSGSHFRAPPASGDYQLEVNGKACRILRVAPGQAEFQGVDCSNALDVRAAPSGFLTLINMTGCMMHLRLKAL